MAELFDDPRCVCFQKQMWMLRLSFLLEFFECTKVGGASERDERRAVGCVVMEEELPSDGVDVLVGTRFEHATSFCDGGGGRSWWRLGTKTEDCVLG